MIAQDAVRGGRSHGEWIGAGAETKRTRYHGYRCRLSSSQYARNEALDRTHPSSAAVSERRLAETIDGYLSTLFDSENIETTVVALVGAAEEPGAVTVARAERAQAKVAEADAKLETYRTALDAGADPRRSEPGSPR